MCGSPGTRPATSALILGCALAVATAYVTSACRREPQPKETDGVVSMGIFPAPNQSEFFEYPLDGVDLGQGWHREGVTKAVATCIEFTVRDDTGQEQSMDLSVVHDNSALMDALDVSAEAQFKSIGYSVSGKARYAKETEVQSSTVNVLAYAKVMNGAKYVAPAEGGRPRRVDLTAHYRDLARSAPLAFEQECGDGFVATVYSGAELTALLSFTETKDRSRTQIEAALSGSAWGFSAHAAAAKMMKAATENSELRVTFHQTGGSGNPMPTTQDGFAGAIERLPALAAKDPHNYRIQVQSYRTLPGYPTHEKEDPDPFRETLATSYGRLLTLRHAVVEVLEVEPVKHYVDAQGDQEPSAIRQRMQALNDELTEKLRRMRTFSERCAFYDKDMGSPEKGQVPCAEVTDLDVRDDYAYRLRLPVMTSKLLGKTDPALIRAAVIDQHVRDVSRRRCERDLQDPGCLLESEIEELKKKLVG